MNLPLLPLFPYMSSRSFTLLVVDRFIYCGACRRRLPLPNRAPPPPWLLRLLPSHLLTHALLFLVLRRRQARAGDDLQASKTEPQVLCHLSVTCLALGLFNLSVCLLNFFWYKDEKRWPRDQVAPSWIWPSGGPRGSPSLLVSFVDSPSPGHSRPFSGSGGVSICSNLVLSSL